MPNLSIALTLYKVNGLFMVLYGYIVKIYDLLDFLVEYLLVGCRLERIFFYDMLTMILQNAIEINSAL